MLSMVLENANLSLRSGTSYEYADQELLRSTSLSSLIVPCFQDSNGRSSIDLRK